MSENIIYTIPGLGFDERIFSKINLSDFTLCHLNWINPELNEPINKYAKRISEKINHTPENCILLGHSFGGMIAQEIAAFLPVKKIILISSIKSKKEKPSNFKSVAPLGLYKYFTKKMTLRTFDYWGKYFGYETEELQELFKKMIAERSDTYLQWALHNLSIWQGTNSNVPIIHIHGEKDKTFPIKLIQEPVIKIKEGTHMMVYNRPHELRAVISQQL